VNREHVRRWWRDSANPAVAACVASPDVRNSASIRAFEKAGFRPVRESLDEGHVGLLMRKECP
jgi:RimJ/RimL family protein N-acetyltransferase